MLRQTGLANFHKIWAYLFTGGMILLSLFPVYWVLTVSLKSKRDSLANPSLALRTGYIELSQALESRHFQRHIF